MCLLFSVSSYLIVFPQALMSWTISLCRNPSTVASFTLAIVSPARAHTRNVHQAAVISSGSTSIHCGFNYCKPQPSEALLILNNTPDTCATQMWRRHVCFRGSQIINQRQRPHWEVQLLLLAKQSNQRAPQKKILISIMNVWSEYTYSSFRGFLFEFNIVFIAK